jgi:hypothetical protein
MMTMNNQIMYNEIDRAFERTGHMIRGEMRRYTSKVESMNQALVMNMRM